MQASGVVQIAHLQHLRLGHMAHRHMLTMLAFLRIVQAQPG